MLLLLFPILLRLRALKYTWTLLIHPSYVCVSGEKSRKSKRKPRIPASVSATYSSTVAEELVALIRKLHTLEAWNPLVNEFIGVQLKSVVTMVTSDESIREEQITQVCVSCLLLRILYRNCTFPVIHRVKCILSTTWCLHSIL